MVIIPNIYKETILTRLIMTCRDMCTQYKALRPTIGVSDICQDKNDVKFVRFSYSGKDSVVHVVDINYDPSQKN